MPQARTPRSPIHVVLTLGDRDGDRRLYHRALARRARGAGLLPVALPAAPDFGAQLALLLERLELLAGAGGRVGIVGSGAGTAPALAAAGLRPGLVEAVIARGGEPERVDGLLGGIRAPTLLIVDRGDAAQVAAFERCARLLRCAHLIERVRGPVECFDGTEQLRKAAALGQQWLRSYLEAPATARCA